MGHKQTTFTQELILYAISAAVSCLVLFAGLKQLDPNRAAAKKAADRKKEIAKKLGRPLVKTNQYEVFRFMSCRSPLSSFPSEGFVYSSLFLSK